MTYYRLVWLIGPAIFWPRQVLGFDGSFQEKFRVRDSRLVWRLYYFVILFNRRFSRASWLFIGGTRLLTYSNFLLGFVRYILFLGGFTQLELRRAHFEFTNEIIRVRLFLLLLLVAVKLWSNVTSYVTTTDSVGTLLILRVLLDLLVLLWIILFRIWNFASFCFFTPKNFLFIGLNFFLS